MPTLYKIFFFAFFFCLSLLETKAQNFTYTFNHLTPDQGLSSGRNNYYVYQDSYGFVWVSSVMGLNRFDGKSVIQYHSDKNDPHALVSEFAAQSRFHEAQNGDLWFTNNESLTRYVRQKDHFEHFQFSLPNGDTARTLYFWAFHDPSSNIIWTSGGRQLFALDLSKGNKQIFVDSLFVGLKDRMFKMPDGSHKLFLCGYGDDTLQVRIYDDLKLSSPPSYYTTDQGAHFYDMRWVSDSLVWLGTDKGLGKLDLRTGKIQITKALLGGQPIEDAREIAIWKGKLLVATSKNGIYIYDPNLDEYQGKILRYINGKSQAFTPVIERMNIDRHNNLWISAKDDGIYFTHLDKPFFEVFTDTNADPLNSVLDIKESSQGGIWVLQPNRVWKINGNDSTLFQLPISGTEFGQATRLSEDSQQRVWVSTYNQLYLLKRGAITFQAVDITPETEYEKEIGYHEIIELENQDLLISTNVLFPFVINKNLQSQNWISPKIKRVRNIITGPNQEIIFTTYQDSLHIGKKLANNQIQIDTSFTKIPFISEIIWDTKRRHYWVGTYNGLYTIRKRHNNKWLFQEYKLALNRLTINSLLLDKKKDLWISLPQGIINFKVDSNKIIRYTDSDGLNIKDFNTSASTKLKTGQLLFGAANGLTKFQPSKIKSVLPLPRPVIVDIQINQSRKELAKYSIGGIKNPILVKKLRLPHNKRNLSLKLAALEYSNPKQCEFKYQLLGASDPSEVLLGSNPILNFPNLGFGKYTLNIWASNANGIWSRQAHSIDLEILPPWYLNRYFIVSFIVLLSYLIFIGIKRRFKRLKEQRKAAETELALLRSQMDPHFIYNSLNSINALILKQENTIAYKYVVKFSDLMRKMLNQAETDLHSIDEEIELLESYLNIESMRLKERLSWVITIDDELDSYDTQIPTMILQPFVENAIWHGIAPLKTGGYIQIRFLVQDKYLVCEVEDNGVGRKKLGSSRKGKGSKSTEITSRRLTLYSKSNPGPKAFHQIIDLKHKDGSAAGTKAQLFFPR